MRTRLLAASIGALAAIAGSGTPAAAQRVLLSGRVDPPPESVLVARLGTMLDSLAAAGSFSGVALLARNGTPVYQHAYGLADREAGRPIDLETDFNLGSINKLFTHIAVDQLVAAGKLHPDSTVGHYWPDYPNQQVAHTVTIRQLLDHRSGIGGNIFDDPPGGSRHDIRRLSEFLPLFVHDSMLFPPGTQEQYSNAGYVVLGLLIERVSGQSYYDYVREHICQPAGMTRTAHYAVDSLPPNTAIGYTRGGPGTPDTAALHRNTADLPGRGSSAGGGYSNAPDLLRLVNAMQAGRIPGAPPGGFGIAGGTGGVNSVVETGIPGGYTLIVLSNLDPPAAMRVSQALRSWISGNAQP